MWSPAKPYRSRQFENYILSSIVAEIYKPFSNNYVPFERLFHRAFFDVVKSLVVTVFAKELTEKDA